MQTLSLEFHRKDGDSPKITEEFITKLANSTMDIVCPEGKK